MTQSSPARPQVAEKTAYKPCQKPEMFIVPLLKPGIESAIERYTSDRAKTGGAGMSPVKALDIGCGGQPFRGLLESRGYRYFGLDIQAAPGIALDFTCPMDQSMPPEVLAAGPYDFILCTEVMEHVLQWDAAFANVSRLLAAGGRILITAPHFYILHEEPYDFFRPTLHALAQFARLHGLTVLENTPLGDAWDILGTLLSCCRFDPVRPTLWNRILAKTLWRFRNMAFRLLLSRRLQRRVSFRGPTYMSNLIVLERSA